jgi:hypothetical protein
LSYKEPFESLDDLETYAEYAHSSILYVIQHSIDTSILDRDIEYAISHIGVACGIVALLKGYNNHAVNVRT